jgi:hypothetical protein
MLEHKIIKLMDNISGVDKFIETVNNYYTTVPKERTDFLRNYSRKCGYNFPELDFELDLMHADIHANILKMTLSQLETFESNIKKAKKETSLKDKLETILFLHETPYNTILKDIHSEMNFREKNLRSSND